MACARGSRMPQRLGDTSVHRRLSGKLVDSPFAALRSFQGADNPKSYRKPYARARTGACPRRG